jgi:hypothetical protein
MTGEVEPSVRQALVVLFMQLSPSAIALVASCFLQVCGKH